MADASGRLGWPKRGVYFLLEDTESSPSERSFRISRIGTHAVSKGSQTTLWDRLSTHRGVNSGLGSHRSSIFRLHVGRALVLAGKHPAIETWGVGQVANRSVREQEADLERLVSSTIGRMRVLWLDIPDEPGPMSDRAYVEKGSIGLLSRMAILQPTKSEQWLGNWSASNKISTSGLWNLNYLYSKPDSALVDVIGRYVEAISGKSALPDHSIAPPNWHRIQMSKSDSRQLQLFVEGSD